MNGGNAHAEGQVALLIDFENLVRSVDEADIDCEAVFRLADEYGRVLVANAYVDWRLKDVNQHQTDLYGLGIELVHVLGRRQGAVMKNAVDVRMAVDAVSLMSSLPHIDVYVIVSGDRDFIHVLKELRRHGKTVIGVSPNSAVSRDFSALCDRFLRYEALTSSVEPTGEESIEEVRAGLREIVQGHPDGILASAVKTTLRRVLSANFDESAYGFASFSTFLKAMNDIVRVVPPPPQGGDLRVYPASAVEPAPTGSGDWASQAKLGKFQYERNARRRRGVISALFDAMVKDPPFTLTTVYGLLNESDGETTLSLGNVVKFGRTSWMARALVVEPEQSDALFRDRRMSLAAHIRDQEALVLAYETVVVCRLLRVTGEAPVDLPQVSSPLGLDDSEDCLAYCSRVLDEAKPLAAAIA